MSNNLTREDFKAQVVGSARHQIATMQAMVAGLQQALSVAGEPTPYDATATFSGGIVGQAVLLTIDLGDGKMLRFNGIGAVPNLINASYLGAATLLHPIEPGLSGTATGTVYNGFSGSLCSFNIFDESGIGVVFSGGSQFSVSERTDFTVIGRFA